MIATKTFCYWKYFYSSYIQTMYSVVIFDVNNIVVIVAVWLESPQFVLRLVTEADLVLLQHPRWRVL